MIAKIYDPLAARYGALTEEFIAMREHRDRLQQENNAYQAAKERVHKSFGFVPHPDDQKKCNCAYCARDFETVAEHAALMEMKLFSLERKSRHD